MQEEVDKEMARVHCEGLVRGLCNAQEMLANKLEKGYETETESAQLREAADALGEFYEKKLSVKELRLRTVRGRDEGRLLEGQHPGCYIILEADDGSYLELNFYGALRVLSSGDLKDRDSTGRFSHTRTTDKILTQPIHINWRLHADTNVESWVVVNNHSNTIVQSSLNINGEPVEAIPAVGPKDHGYSDAKSSLSAATQLLAQMVPFSG